MQDCTVNLAIVNAEMKLLTLAETVIVCLGVLCRIRLLQPISNPIKPAATG